MKLLSLGIFAVLLVAFSCVFTQEINNFGRANASGLTSLESQIVQLVNGTRAFNDDLALERIAFNHSLSDYSFRTAGSRGDNATADWIVSQFESFGLETYSESYAFTNWNVFNEPILLIDDDGNPDTTTGQTLIGSFLPVMYSLGTLPDGVFGDLVVLPLPPAENVTSIGRTPINMTEWNAINTTSKIVFVGREVRWSSSWEQTFKTKLTAQTPIAVVYTWWYDWMSWVPPVFYAVDGRPGRGLGPYFWDLKIPAGFVDYEAGAWIRSREASLNVSARVEVDAVISQGLQSNIIGKLRGSVYPEKVVIVSAHRDTVMTSGFCDNGAGTAAVIELARIFSEANRTGLLRPKYTILFLLFDGEEAGLAGSINYVKQHRSELGNIVAVLNLDCLGSDHMDYSDTIPDPATGLDLDQLVIKAAQDLGVNVTSAGGPGGSDETAFADPPSGEWYYSYFWDLPAGIEDANPVESALTLSSHPTFFTERWDDGTWGWMHTSYDNSTSTSTLNWVETDDLQSQVEVAVLSTMRIAHVPAIAGDVDGNGRVNMGDINALCDGFGSTLGQDDYYWHHPPCIVCPHNPNCDIDYNRRIDMGDINYALDNFGKHYP